MRIVLFLQGKVFCVGKQVLSVFENQLVVGVVFEVPLPQKMILLSVDSREIFSSPSLHSVRRERRRSRCNITQRWCQLLGQFQTKDFSCILKCKCSAWKAVLGSTGEAAEGKTQARAINFYQTVQWHTNCFCIKVVLPSWESSEER